MNPKSIEGKKLLLHVRYVSIDDVPLSETTRICLIMACTPEALFLRDVHTGEDVTPLPPMYEYLNPIDPSQRWKLNQYGDDASDVTFVIAFTAKMGFSTS
jgi:hypothetical protein